MLGRPSRPTVPGACLHSCAGGAAAAYVSERGPGLLSTLRSAIPSWRVDYVARRHGRRTRPTGGPLMHAEILFRYAGVLRCPPTARWSEWSTIQCVRAVPLLLKRIQFRAPLWRQCRRALVVVVSTLHCAEHLVYAILMLQGEFQQPSDGGISIRRIYVAQGDLHHGFGATAHLLLIQRLLDHNPLTLPLNSHTDREAQL